MPKLIRMPKMSTELSLGQLTDSFQDLSVETFLTGDQSWTSQQADLDQQVAENLSDEDLDALSRSEYLLTSAQFQIEAYSSSTLVQKTSIFGLGAGLDFNVDVSQLPTGELVVAKRVNLFASLSRKNGSTVSDLSRRVRKVLQEIRILKHPPLESCESIVRLLGVSWENVNGDFTTPSLVFEYAEFGTLRQYLSRSSSPLSTTEKQPLGLQVGRALLTLHGCGVCHGDVKLDNVLIVGGPLGKPTAKLADFGSSIIIQPGESQRTYWGTQVYNAPELRSDQDKQSGSTISTTLLFACDIFSFGLLLYELIHDGIPYWKSHGIEEPTIEIALKSSSFKECGDVGSETTAVALLRQAVALCLKEQPEQRNDLVPILEVMTGELENL
jgi:serine/threonine protein kinase